MNYIRPLINAGGRAGHQFSQMLAALDIAEKYGLKYIYTPFAQSSQHQYHDQAKWNQLFRIDGVPRKSVPKLKEVKIPRTVSVMANNDLALLDETIKKHRNCVFVCAVDLFRKINWRVCDRIDIWRGPRETRDVIAVHIRRGDISKKYMPNRWVDLEYYDKLLQNIRRATDLPIHVYSDGTREQLKGLERHGVTFCVGRSDVQSMVELVNAKVLVTSKSNFSTLAAYSSRELKLSMRFYPYWCDFPNRDDICPIDEHGNFDRSHLERHLCT